MRKAQPTHTQSDDYMEKAQKEPEEKEPDKKEPEEKEFEKDPLKQEDLDSMGAAEFQQSLAEKLMDQVEHSWYRNENENDFHQENMIEVKEEQEVDHPEVKDVKVENISSEEGKGSDTENTDYKSPVEDKMEPTSPAQKSKTPSRSASQSEAHTRSASRHQRSRSTKRSRRRRSSRRRSSTSSSSLDVERIGFVCQNMS